MVAALLAAALLTLGMPPADAAPGSTDPAQAPRICSQGTLTADATQPWQRHFVRVEVPTGATITITGTVLARSIGAVGFIASWGLITADNPNGGMWVDRCAGLWVLGKWIGPRLGSGGTTTTSGTAAGGARVSHLGDDVARQVDEAIERAAQGKIRFPGHDGKVFDNADGLLPPSGPGYYSEWTAAAAASGAKRGAHRVIIGGNPARPDVIYYWDHAGNYVQVWP